MTLLHSIILGIIEGITEFLPVSSTGHLILASTLLHVEESSFTKSFEIIIQLGAILAVIVLYWTKIWNIERIKKLIVGFIPTGIIGLTLYKVVKAYLLGNTTVVLWALLIGGMFLIAFEYWYEKRPLPETDVEPTYTQALIIGFFQSLAIIPGVSRSAATIVGGLTQGLSRKAIIEFSFLLAIPTVLAASGLDMLKNHNIFSSGDIAVLSVGFVVSFIVALFSIKFLLKFIQTKTFKPFGVYRVIVAIVFWLILK